MYKWQLHEAKNKLSHLVDTAIEGEPQYITRRGKDAVVVIAIKDYQKLKRQRLGFNEFLLSGPKSDDLEIARVKGGLRELDL